MAPVSKPNPTTTRDQQLQPPPDRMRHDPEQNYAGHYLHATPSPVPGVVGLMVAFALLTFGISEIRTEVSKTASIQVASAGDTITEGAAVLVVSTEGWTLNDQPVQESDLVFRLSGAAGRSPVIIVEHTTGLPAARLAQALDLVNQAGFTQVGVRPTPAVSQ